MTPAGPGVGAVGIAFALDLLVREFPARVHPVALVGRVIELADRPWRWPRVAGVGIAVALPLAVAVLAYGTVTVAGLWGPVALAVVAGLVLFSVTSLRLLTDVATGVVADTDGDLEAARERVVALVGRETATLSPAALRSAAVESAAENLADGLVAPLFWFAVGLQVSLAVGVAAAAWVKTVNTLDSMLGYRDRPVGWASARLDDVAMWLPARLTAVLLAVAAGDPRAVVRARRWARTPASPNAGWPMATLAVARGVCLEKPDHYVLNEGAPRPTHETARASIRTVAIAGVLAFVSAGVVAWA